MIHVHFSRTDAIVLTSCDSFIFTSITWFLHFSFVNFSHVEVVFLPWTIRVHVMSRACLSTLDFTYYSLRKKPRMGLLWQVCSLNPLKFSCLLDSFGDWCSVGQKNATPFSEAGKSRRIFFFFLTTQSGSDGLCLTQSTQFSHLLRMTKNTVWTPSSTLPPRLHVLCNFSDTAKTFQKFRDRGTKEKRRVREWLFIDAVA